MYGPLREPFTVMVLHLNHMCYINNNGSSVMSTSELKMMHGQSPQGAVAEQGAHNFSVTSQCMDGPLWEPLFMPAYPVHPCTINPNSSTKGNSLSPTNISNPRLGCNILNYTISWTNVVMAAMLGGELQNMLQVIMIARLHAMYQGSRTMLLFLLIIFLAVNIACVVLAAIGVKYMVAEETILSGVHMCGYSYEGDVLLLVSMVWMLNTVWEVLALCLSVWIAVKHFRDLRRLGPLTGSTVRDCFRVLIESHVLYFASFASVSCFQLICLSPALSGTAAMIFAGTRAVLEVMQMFVLGPRLILSVREYHAKLIAGSDADTSMNSIVFQEHVHISTSGTV
ncbi:hypothetical protein EDD22DRAFT_844268 [Suillus occidentalis]|nr:hypothetical protein EDD22DRAFT_844268 [Suillus occidentalis]